MEITTWATKLITKSNAVFDDTSIDEIREHLNDAIILHRRYIRDRCNGIYSKNEALTLISDGYELDLPFDMDNSVTALVRASEQGVNPLTSLDFSIQRGKVLFSHKQPADSVFWIEYTAIPNYYEANTDDCPELDYPDVRRMLEKEVIASVIKVEDDFESSNAVNNLIAESNLSQQG